MLVRGKKIPKILVKMADVSIFGHFLTPFKILGITKTCLYCRRRSKLQFGGLFMKIG